MDQAVTQAARDAYEQGKREFHTAPSFLSNPYEKGTAKHAAWLTGWRDEDGRRCDEISDAAPSDV